MKAGSGIAALSLVAALGLAACASSGGTNDTGATATSTSDSTTSATDDAASATEFSVNDASQSEIAAVLAAAGVPSAEQWAREVVEYRPYDMADPAMTHLRDELAKYNPSDETVDQIVAALRA